MGLAGSTLNVTVTVSVSIELPLSVWSWTTFLCSTHSHLSQSSSSNFILITYYHTNSFHFLIQSINESALCSSSEPNPKNGAGPGGVCRQLLKVSAEQLAELLHGLCTLSLRNIMSCACTHDLIPQPTRMMKTLERLFLRHLGPETEHAQDPQQFGYQDGVRVEDAVLRSPAWDLQLIWRSLAILWQLRSFDFSSAFSTI